MAVELGWSAQGGVVRALTNTQTRDGADGTRGAAFFKNYQPIIVKIFSLRYKKILGPLIQAINEVGVWEHDSSSYSSTYHPTPTLHQHDTTTSHITCLTRVCVCVRVCQGGDVTHLLELITAMVESFSLRGAGPRSQFVKALLAALDSLEIWHKGIPTTGFPAHTEHTHTHT